MRGIKTVERVTGDLLTEFSVDHGKNLLNVIAHPNIFRNLSYRDIRLQLRHHTRKPRGGYKPMRSKEVLIFIIVVAAVLYPITQLLIGSPKTARALMGDHA
jgi:hypothetical protein